MQILAYLLASPVLHHFLQEEAQWYPEVLKGPHSRLLHQLSMKAGWGPTTLPKDTEVRTIQMIPTMGDKYDWRGYVMKVRRTSTMYMATGHRI